MWLSLALAILTYLLSSKGTASQRQSALAKAALVGGGSYLVTQNTDWGKDISGKFDSAVGLGPTATPAAAAAAANGERPISVGTSASGTSPNGNGLWSTLSGWGAAGIGAVAGASLAGGSGTSKILLYGALALGAYFILKD